MTVNSQPLVNHQKIVNPDGTPTDYFIRWAQQRLTDIAAGVLPSRRINTNAGLQGGGDLSADRTLSLVNPYVYITQADYNALAPPDPNTYYYIPATGSGSAVTSFAFTNGGGISGTVVNPTTTPTLTLTLDANGIVLSKLAAATAASILGATAAGNASYLTPAQAKTVLAITSGDVSGLSTVATSGAFSDTTGTVGVTRGGTGLTALVLGDILYSSAANTVSALSGNITATKKFLTQTGTGAVSAAPAWSAIAAADVPTLNQNTTGSAATLTTPRNIDGQSFNGSADINVIAPGTHAATSKATPVDADEIPLADSAAANALKKLTWANLKATLLATVMSWTARQTFSALTIGTFAVDGSWTAYTPAISSETGVITSYTINTAYYKRIGNLVAIHVDVTITNAGSAAFALFVGLPFTIGGGNTVGMVIRWGDKVLGGWDCGVGFASTGVRKYDGTTFIATGAQLVLSGIYECA